MIVTPVHPVQPPSDAMQRLRRFNTLKIVDKETPTSPPREQDTYTPTTEPPRLNQLRKLQSGPVGQYQTYAEIERICRIPVYTGMDENELAAYNQQNILAEAYAGGFRLFQPQAEIVSAYEVAGGAMGAIGVGFGKCVRADTEIWDVYEGRRPVTREGATTIISKDDDGKMLTTSGEIFRSGEKPCYRLRLASGQSVGLSADHPVFTHRGWVEVKDLLADDLVATPRQLPDSPHPLDISDDELKFVAYLLADGGTSQPGTIRLSDTPGPVVDEFCGAVRALGGEATVIPSKSKAVQVNVRSMLPLARKWGLMGVLSKHKRVPDDFYCLDQRQIALFINRFCACDGHVNVASRLIEITLASGGLIKDIQFLLLRLGIPSRYSYKAAKLRGEVFDAWRLVVSSKPNVTKFMDVVGCPLGQSDRVRRLNDAMVSITTNTNTDIVPIGPLQLKEVCDELGCMRTGGDRRKITGRPRTDLKERLGATEGQWVGREAFASWVKDSGYKGKYAWLATSDILWERIRSLEYEGIFPVWDVSVPTVSNFIGNGIVLHNTLAALMIANKAYAKGLTRILLTVPAQVLGQLTQTDIKWARNRVAINYPIHVLGGRGKEDRLLMASSRKRGLYILPYSLLSTADTHQMIETIDPQLWIADEVHNLANQTSARNRRWREFMSKHKPEFVGMSGTITAKSIKDYFHMILFALDLGSPLPITSSLANEWAAIIDAEAGSHGYTGAAKGPLAPLLAWARSRFPKEADKISEDLAGFRRAYKLRLNSVPGVVSTGDASVGTSLIMANRPVVYPEGRPGWDALQKHIKTLEDMWVTPNGDEIEHAIHKYKWNYELSAGFYNELTWPTAEMLLERRRRGSLFEAMDLLARSKNHHALQQAYARVLRKWLEEKSKPGIDTPMLCGNSMHKDGDKFVGPEMYAAWRAWHDADFEGRPERDSRAVRVCDYKINAAVDWVKSLNRKGAILWYDNIEVGQWLTEALIAAGIDALHCPSGERYNTIIRGIGDYNAGGKGDRIVVATFNAHGQGKNLQAFENQYFVQWTRPAKEAEQTIGRTHRAGQRADELIVYTNATLEFDRILFAATLNDALYVTQTTGNRHRLIYAAYDPLPTIFPDAVHKERGMEIHTLNAEQRKLMEEKFS